MRHGLAPLDPSAEERSQLEWVAERGSEWRERQRAQTLLYFAEGWTAKAIAERQKLNLDTVYDRRKHWLESGWASLKDKPRCGAPSKLNAAQRQLLRTWATNDALTGPALREKLQTECGVTVHVNTVIGALHRMGFVWKRTRHSLKKNGTIRIS